MKDKKKTTDKIKLTLKENYFILYFIPVFLLMVKELNCNILNGIIAIVEFLYIATLFGFWIYRKKYSYKNISFYSALFLHISLYAFCLSICLECLISFFVSIVAFFLYLLIKMYRSLEFQFNKNQLVNNKIIAKVISLCFVSCTVSIILWFCNLIFYTHLIYCYILSAIAVILIVCLLYLIFENRENEQFNQYDPKKDYLDKYFGIVFLIIVIIALVSYVIYQIFYNYDVNHTLFSSLMGIWACFLGGFLTLSGVAWTIKNQAKIFKEQEKIKNIPMIIKLSTDNPENMIKDSQHLSAKDFNIRNEPFDSFLKSTNKYICIEDFFLKNTDLTYFCIEGLEINCTNYELNENIDIFINKNEYIYFDFSSFALQIKEKIDNIRLITKDIRGVRYAFSFVFITVIKEKIFNTYGGENIAQKKKIRTIIIKDIKAANEIGGQNEK